MQSKKPKGDLGLSGLLRTKREPTERKNETNEGKDKANRIVIFLRFAIQANENYNSIVNSGFCLPAEPCVAKARKQNPGAAVKRRSSMRKKTRNYKESQEYYIKGCK